MLKSLIAAIVALLIAPFGVFHHGVAASPTQHAPAYALATTPDVDTGEAASAAAAVEAAQQYPAEEPEKQNSITPQFQDLSSSGTQNPNNTTPQLSYLSSQQNQIPRAGGYTAAPNLTELANPIAAFATKADLASTTAALQSEIAAIGNTAATAPIPQQVAAGGNFANPFSAAQSINNLSNVTINDSTITNSSGAGASALSGLSDVALSSPASGNLLEYNGSSWANVATSSLGNFGGAGSWSSITVTSTSTLAGITLSNLNCSTSGNGGKLTTDAFGNVICAADQGGSGSTVAGSNTQVQFNDGGSFGANAAFTFDKTSNRLTVTNASTTNFSAISASTSAATSTTLFSTLANFTSAVVGTLNTSIANIVGITATNATTTNLIATNATTTNLAVSGTASTSALTASNSFTLPTSFSGVLHAAAGVVSAAAVNLASDVTGFLPVGNGGTGTSTTPSYGQVLVGNSSGGYNLIATSSLGIAGNAPTWGAITGTLSNQTDLQNALDAKFSLSNWYATTTNGLAEGSNNLYFTNARADARFVADIAATTSVKSITTLSSLSLPASQVSGISGTFPISYSSGAISIVATSSFGCTVSCFASHNISQWTNDAGYVTSSFSTTSANYWGGTKGYLTSLAGAASSTLLGDNNTFSGTDIFNNTITGAISGNAGTVTNGVYTTTFNNLFDNRLSASSSISGITTLPNLSLPYTQVSGTPNLALYFPLSTWYATTSAAQLTALANLATVGTISSGTWHGTAIADSYISSSGNWNTAYSDRITSANYPLSISSNVLSTVATSSENCTVSCFASANISQWTNNSNYLTSLAGAASSTLLTDNNTFSGNTLFNASTTFQKQINAQQASSTVFSVSGIAYLPGSGIWNSSGNVGIGTTTPWTTLSVVGSEELQTSAMTIAASSRQAKMGDAGFVVVNQHYAYVTASNASANSLTVFDVSSSTNPVMLTQISGVAATNGAEGEEIAGQYLYVTDMTGSALSIFDISAPANPVLVGYLQDSTNLHGAEHLRIVGNYAYVVDYNTTGSDPGLTVVDISNPTAPRVVGTLINSNVVSPTYIQVRYPYAYVTNQSNTKPYLNVINISNPVAPILAKTVTLSGILITSDFFGRYLYVSDRTGNSIFILDTSTPTSTVLVNTISTGSHDPATIKIVGNSLYTTSFTDNSLLQYSLASSTNPTLTSTLTDNTNLYTPDDVISNGTQLYVSTHGNGSTINGGLSIIDIASLITPALNAGSIISDTLDVTHDIHANRIFADSGLIATAILSQNLSAASNFFAASSTLSSIFAGTVGIGTTTPGSIFSVQGVANWTGATTTYYSTGGINLTAGCFSINGTCIGGSGGGGSGTVNSGTGGQFAFYSAPGTAVSATSSLFLNTTTSFIGIGTTTPDTNLSIYSATRPSLEFSLGAAKGNWTEGIDTSNGNTFEIASSTALGTNPRFVIAGNGNVGIGTIAPTTALEVVGDITSKGTSWTARTAASLTTEWTGITYGNGLFVAVAGGDLSNSVMTSPDGVNWTIRTAAVANDWNWVVYGNGLFVAVSDDGSGNRVMTSPNGITWTSRASAANSAWQGLAYGNGLFVAVSAVAEGIGSDVMTSPDGITWTARTAAVNTAWISITYGNGLFVAVSPSASGIGSDVMTSPDGITWTARTAAANIAWDGITYGNGLFVAVAAGDLSNSVMTSPDGITWTARTAAVNNAWISITYGNGLFVAVSADGSGNSVMTSPDGITWTSRAGAANNLWFSVTYGNGLFVATALGIGAGGPNTISGVRVMTSGKEELNAVATNNLYQGGMNIFGNVGIGTTTPYSRLEVWGPDAASSTLAFNVVNNASTTVFAVFDGGNAQLAGALTQSSDQRLKTNVQSLDASNSLAAIEALNPVSFNWINGIFGGGQQLGFIAQQVQGLFPQLVSTTSPTALTPNGTLGLNYSGLIAPIVGAVKDIAAISGDFETNLIAWLGNASNGIQDLFANNLHAQNEICISSTCINQQQLAAILASQASSQSEQGGDSASNVASSSVASSATPPVLQVNGDNPAIIQIGATYNDLGATLTGPTQDLNLGLEAIVDGSATTSLADITLDTSQPAAHTVEYIATDQDGLEGTATRTVIVEPAPTDPSAASTTPDDSGQGTATTTSP